MPRREQASERNPDYWDGLADVMAALARDAGNAGDSAARSYYSARLLALRDKADALRTAARRGAVRLAELDDAS